ncbi:trans-acting enoyl reductase family protein [Corynebacterium sp. LK28]|uniref:saccharopine dehydrogenase family protein n=1 Tax=Corynebacterium sp. LK28 TaxID=2044579 RepID=UPI0016527929|nr:saccharopine dehydrogenase NADP-binding domain-containing protein [Corynebacterium sp. LK28]MBC6795166.1 trans-2-enoyl-CoA reductase [Corynebacterium sp. LK28]
MNNSPSRSFDITLLGATGFVGTLTAEYLAAHAPADVRIALAGRNQAKLEALREKLTASHPRAADFPLIIADSSDNRSLEKLARDTRVVISTVGPYYRYGFPLVRECATHGTHYVDLAGEPLFMRESADSYHDIATASGARIIHACGFDSVPSDLGMLLLGQRASENKDTLETATMIVKMKGGLSGGTIDSMREQFAAIKGAPEKKRLLAAPYTLSPDRDNEPDLGKQPDFGVVRDSDIGGTKDDVWAGPFIMAGSNTRVVRRSHALLGHKFGDKLRYSEYLYTGKGFKGRMRAFTMGAVLGTAVAALSQDKLRKFLSRWVPEPGEGPSEAERNAGFFHTTHIGVSPSGATYTNTISLAADPGYKGTSLMLSEAALTLVLCDAELPTGSPYQGKTGGGVLTPATGLGMPYVRRLSDAGMKFSD